MTVHKHLEVLGQEQCLTLSLDLGLSQGEVCWISLYKVVVNGTRHSDNLKSESGYIDNACN